MARIARVVVPGLPHHVTQRGNRRMQTRSHNLANELTGFGQGTGQAHWIDPNYDPAGNMASGPRGDAPTARLHFKWDAWNRLCEVRADSNGSPGTPGGLIASYRYDGRNYRIFKHVAGDANTDYYYNDSLGLRSLGEGGWQCLEEWKNGSARGAVSR